MSITRTENALLTDLRLGLPEAVEVWYKKYHSQLFRLVKTKVDKKEDVEEIVRETFLNCLRHLPVFNGNCSIKTWMFKIASHEIADYYRRYYAKKVIHAIPLSSMLFAETPRNMHESSQVVTDILQKMRLDYSELLLLKYVDKIPVKYIAERLNRSIKSVEADLFRARKEFRELYVELAVTVK